MVTPYLPIFVGLHPTMLVISNEKDVVQNESIRLKIRPDSPWNGSPDASSCRPGASPIKRRKGACPVDEGTV